ncbi:protein UXT homolog [Ostrea edulis]|uniref:protein UXT homolog n=1 Tax=Ostrea edulis TaxID=37623 RepID=UPI0020941BE9|nr:protein UXT homolog [Ostrea edulis]XP_055999520.1 protein UXT homolog [Ostrea edulis]
MCAESIPSKVLQYEQFLNERLKTDLSQVVDQRDKLYGEVAEYLQLKTVIERIKESDFQTNGLKTKVDLGCNFYVQAHVPDASMIFVSVGYGFFLEMTHTEALAFIEKKVSINNAKIDALTTEVAKIKAHIKLVLQGLQEIQNLDYETEKPYRDVLS